MTERILLAIFMFYCLYNAIGVFRGDWSRGVTGIICIMLCLMIGLVIVEIAAVTVMDFV